MVLVTSLSLRAAMHDAHSHAAKACDQLTCHAAPQAEHCSPASPMTPPQVLAHPRQRYRP